MAIRRCPYCKAIIDEQDKYCNNCGTQLLFPEDEFIEEQIPGDKIVVEDVAEKEEQKEEAKVEELEEEDEIEEEEKSEEPTQVIRTVELVQKPAEADKPQKKYEVSIEEDELVFKTKELDNLTGTVDEGKEKLEECLSSFQKVKAKAVTPHEVPALFQEGEEPGSGTKEVLPPWASGMKETPPPSAGLEKSKETVSERGAESEIGR